MLQQGINQAQDSDRKGVLYYVHNLAQQESGLLFYLNEVINTDVLTVKMYTDKRKNGETIAGLKYKITT